MERFVRNVKETITMSFEGREQHRRRFGSSKHFENGVERGP